MPRMTPSTVATAQVMDAIPPVHHLHNPSKCVENREGGRDEGPGKYGQRHHLFSGQ